MKFLRQFHRRERQKPTSFSLIDIGRDMVKAVVVQVTPDMVEPQVVGCGLAQTGGYDITGGRLEAAAVTAPVNAALTQAEDSTERIAGRKIVPDDVIFALTGRATIGRLFTVQQTRPKPAEPISAKELANLRTRAERLVRQGLAALPVEGGQWQALAVTDAGVRLDGHLVLNGLGLTGRDITFSVFGVAGQAGALRALQVLANRLDLVIANVVASSQALAAVTPHAEAIILDTGLSGTDICLIRDNALMAAGSIPFGGSFFAQSLAQVMDIKLEEAEKLKRAFAAGTLSQREADRIEAYLVGPRRRWYEAILEFFAGLSLNKPLPRKVYLTGGGNLLPGLDKLLRANSTPFDRAPEVIRLGERPLPVIKDLTGALDYNLCALVVSLTIGLPDE